MRSEACVEIAPQQTFADIVQADKAGWLGVHDVAGRLLGEFLGSQYSPAKIAEVRERVDWFNFHARDQFVPLRLQLMEGGETEVRVAVYIDASARTMFDHGEPGEEM